MTTIIVDTESNGLLPMADRLWCVSVKVDNGETHSFSHHEDFIEYLLDLKPTIVVFHNGIGHDLEVLKRIWGIDYKIGKIDEWLGMPVQFVDTLLWSLLSNPDFAGGHSLENWGDFLGFPKMDFRAEMITEDVIPYGAPNGAEFKQFHPKMIDYCERDVEVCSRIYHYLHENDKWDTFYQQWWVAAKLTFASMAQQGFTGITFDGHLANNLHTRISEDMATIEAEVEPQLPPRPLNKGEIDDFRFPAKPFLKDGSWSANMHRWVEKTGATKIDDRTVELHGQTYTIVGGEPTKSTGKMNLSNQADLKDYLLEQGWKPTLFNIKKDPKGKPVKGPDGKQIRTTPKFHERGKLCPNLEALQGDLVKKTVRWLSCRNRKSVIKGWLDNERLTHDGRLTAGSSGITPTQRQKHSCVANVPKAKDDVLYGKEMRSLFKASEGKALVGWDASGLEDRLKAHWVYKYDNGEYADKILNPTYDVHQEFADLWGIPRHIAKNGVYALAYWCGPQKLAETIKCSLRDAKRYHALYWEVNQGLRQLDEALALHWEAWGKKKAIRGLDGRPIFTRARHSLVNALIQSTGSIVFDYANMWVDKEIRKCYNTSQVNRVVFYHDEDIYESDVNIAEHVGSLGVKSIKWAGEYFKLNVPLLSEFKVGKTWADLK